MKRNLLKLAVPFLIASLFTFAGCVGKSHDTSKEKAYAEQPAMASVERGHELYEKYCIECHGEEAKGDGPRAVSGEVEAADLTATGLHVTNYGLLVILDKPHYSEDAIQRQVLHGGSEMPSLKDVLSEPQIEDVTNYVKTLIYK